MFDLQLVFLLIVASFLLGFIIIVLPAYAYRMISKTKMERK